MKKILILSCCTITILLSTRIEVMMQSCKAEKAGACTEVALMYDDGSGVEKNTTQAEVIKAQDTVPKVCSILDPDCEACQ